MLTLSHSLELLLDCPVEVPGAVGRLRRPPPDSHRVNPNHLLAADRLRQLSAAAEACEPRPDVPRKAKQEHRFLSGEEKVAVVTAYSDGASLRQLASDHGVHRSTVSTILKESGIAKRPRGMSMEQVERAHQMRSQGLSLSALASAMDLPSTTIRSALMRHGLWT